MHNYGTGHAWCAGATYGDNYDITGGGSGATAHLGLAAKHRFKWVTDDQLGLMSPGDAAQTFTVRPFDRADAPAHLQ